MEEGSHLEVVEGERHAARARDGKQVQHRVGGAAERHDDGHRVLKGGPRHDVARLYVRLEQLQDGAATATVQQSHPSCVAPDWEPLGL